MLNNYYFATGNPDFFNEDLARYRALAPEDVQAAIQKFLPAGKRVELTVVPRKRPRNESACGPRESRGPQRGPPRGVANRRCEPTRARASGGRGDVVCWSLGSGPALAQVPDRSAPPKPGPVPSLKLPAIQKRQLANGLPVWIVELHEVPVAQVDLVLRAGSAADPAGKEGLASLTAAMLDEGAGARDALALADAIDFLGADVSTGSGFDSTSVRLHVPVARLGDALPLMADVALRPSSRRRNWTGCARSA